MKRKCPDVSTREYVILFFVHQHLSDGSNELYLYRTVVSVHHITRAGFITSARFLTGLILLTVVFTSRDRILSQLGCTSPFTFHTLSYRNSEYHITRQHNLIFRLLFLSKFRKYDRIP